MDSSSGVTPRRIVGLNRDEKLCSAPELFAGVNLNQSTFRRSLLSERVRQCRTRFSWIRHRRNPTKPCLLRAKCFDGVQHGGATCRIDTKADSDNEGDAECHDRRPELNNCRSSGQPTHEPRNNKPTVGDARQSFNRAGAADEWDVNEVVANFRPLLLEIACNDLGGWLEAGVTVQFQFAGNDKLPVATLDFKDIDCLTVISRFRKTEQMSARAILLLMQNPHLFL